MGPTSQSYATVIGSSSTRTSPNFSRVVVILSYFSTYFSLMQQVIGMTKGTGGMRQLKKKKRTIKPLALFILPIPFLFPKPKVAKFHRKFSLINFSHLKFVCYQYDCEFSTYISWGTQTDDLKSGSLALATAVLNPPMPSKYFPPK